MSSKMELSLGSFGLDKKDVAGDGSILVGTIEMAAGEKEIRDVVFLEINELCLFACSHVYHF